MPSDIPHVNEVGATSAPLKSAAFFIGAYCKEYNGSFVHYHSNGEKRTFCISFSVFETLRGLYVVQE